MKATNAEMFRSYINGLVRTQEEANKTQTRLQADLRELAGRAFHRQHFEKIAFLANTIIEYSDLELNAIDQYQRATGRSMFDRPY